MAQQIARLPRVDAPARGSVISWPLVRRLLGRFGLHLLAIGLGAAIALPLFWAVSSSLEQAREGRQLPPLWLPGVIQGQNYPAVWGSRLFGIWAWNSVFLTVVGTVGTV